MLPITGWPTNLFSAAAETGQKKVDETKCVCGCGYPHNHSVDKVIGHWGRKRVLWFRHNDHRKNWEAANPGIK